MRRAWYSRSFDALAAFRRDMRVGTRSLRRTRALSVTVVVTLALGIGANAAIFSVVGSRPISSRRSRSTPYWRCYSTGASTRARSSIHVHDVAGKDLVKSQ
jgi:hypothetical protein